MWRKLCFVTSFVLVLALCGVGRADFIDINNPSFEYACDGNRVTGHGTACSWLENAEGAGGWTGADVMCPYASDAHCHRWPGPTDPCGTGTDVVYQYIQHDSGCNIYQILDMNNSDANAVIQTGRRYTLTCDALVGAPDESGNQLKAVLFYLEEPCQPDVNHMVLASKVHTVLWIDRPTQVCKGTSSLDSPSDCPNWNYDLKLIYVASPGYDGNTLGIKFQSVGQAAGDYTFIDNVRLDWQWATQAYSPNPEDGATDVPKDATLSWSPGLWAKAVNGHDVYFGSTRAEVDSATTDSNEFKGIQSPNSFDPTPGANVLTLGESYYWRIDEVNKDYNSPPGPVPYPPGGKFKGEIWSFTVAGRAKNPKPPDAATDVPKNVILRWTRGAESLYHDVYFGSTDAEVTAATTGSDEYKTQLNKGTELYDAATEENPQVNEQYFWRIDEVNTMTVKGHTWDFTVANFILIEDFDLYASHDAQRAVWHDWLSGHSGNAEVWINKDPNWVVDGNSMRFDYWNNTNPKYSEAYRSYSSAQDWSYAGNGVTALEVDFFGDVNSNPDPPMYVKLSDGSTTVQVNPGPNDVSSESLQTWFIPLKDFSPVTLNSITAITLGIGDKVGEGGGLPEQGTLYFDDIRLMPPGCYPDYSRPAADFSRDCRVDANDLRIFGLQWCLKGRWGPPEPVVEYMFEEGSGTTVANTGSYGSSHDLRTGETWTAGGGIEACPNNDPCWVNDNDPCRGWSMWFDGEAGRKPVPGSSDPIKKGADYFVIPPLNLNSDAVTIAAWLKPDPCVWNTKTSGWEQLGSFSGIVHNRRGPGDTAAGHETAAGMSYGSGAGWVYNGMLAYVWNDNAGPTWSWKSDILIPDFYWTMNVLVVEPTQATVYLYDPCATPPLSSASNVMEHYVEEFDWRTVIAGDGGGGADRFWRGQMDAVRIYGFSLTEAQIQDVVNDIPLTGIMYFPLASEADMCIGRKDPCDPCAPINDQVDYCDFSKFADEWRVEALWPLP